VGHYANPTGATGPFRGAVRRVPTHWTSEPGWAEQAIQNLLDRRDIVVDGVFIRGRSLNPRVAVWPQLRARLRAHGIETPREVPDEPTSAAEWRALRWGHVGVPQRLKLSVGPPPTGMTGPAG
jgi:hypothetical protein